MAHTDIGSRDESAGHWLDRHCGTSHDEFLGVGRFSSSGTCAPICFDAFSEARSMAMHTSCVSGF